jgi:hypothetical protein
VEFRVADLKRWREYTSLLVYSTSLMEEKKEEEQ